MHPYLTDDDRWEAVQRRDRAAEGAFLIAVKTTGVYCLPSCQGRPLRRNVEFFEGAPAARAAGYRPCKHCRPDEPRETLTWATAPTSLGLALVAMSGRGVRAILLGDDEAALAADLAARFRQARLAHDPAAIAQALAAVANAVDTGAALTLPLDAQGSDLAQAVWAQLRVIPAGRTASYAEVARAIGRPRAARAVAQACAANPLAVVVPCHRVVRSDGALSGYRWGAARKRALLAREAAA